MTSLSTLIYYPRSIALISNGVFTGFALSVSLVTVPSILSSSDPLPAFVTLYNRGKYFASTTILAAAAGHFTCYHHTKNRRYALSGILSLASIPFTLFIMKPAIDDLISMAGAPSYDRKVVQQLVTKWDHLHWFRTVFSSVAFLLAVFQ